MFAISGGGGGTGGTGGGGGMSHIKMMAMEEKKEKFQAGDVVVTAKGNYTSEVPFGTIGVVVEKSQDKTLPSGCWLVDFAGYGGKPFHEMHLVLAEDASEKKNQPMKKLTTKEEYLQKLLDGVEVMIKVKEMNLEENKMIDEFIESLVEEMKPEEQRKQEQKEKEEQEKKEQEAKKAEEREEASKKNSSEEQSKKEEKQEGSGQKSKPTTTEKEKQTSTKVEEKMKSFMEELQKLKAMQQAMKEEGMAHEGETNAGAGEMEGLSAGEAKAGQGQSTGKAGTGAPRERAEGIGGLNDKLNDGAGGTSADAPPMEIEPFTGGEAQGRNKSVKKEKKTGRLHASPRIST